MKRVLWPLVLMLLLCGCVAPGQQETTAPPPVTAGIQEENGEADGIYVPFTDLETRTDGQVRYFLPEADCYGIRMMGSDVLTFSGTEKTTLTRYAGERLCAVATVTLDCRIEPEDTAFQISGHGITYYHPENREVVFLDNELKVVSRLDMPENMVGKPVLSGNRMQLYYCSADAIRVYDTATALDRLLKTIDYPRQSVETVLLKDTVLRCELEDDRGEKTAIFVSTQTGELLGQVPAGLELATYENACFAKNREGIQELLVFGEAGEEPRMLTPRDPFARSWYVEEFRGVVTAATEAEVTALDYYDLESGLRTASVELPGNLVPRFVEARVNSGSVVIMADDSAAEAPAILIWQTDAASAPDETVYVSPRYTEENPDVSGLEACARMAEEISEQHGVEIRIAWEAAAQQPWDYVLELEYQPTVIRKQLERLEALLSAFPEGFFEKLSKKPAICLVREIRGDAQSGSVDKAWGIQFWEQNRPYVALAAGDGLEGAFFHEMFHILDGKILSDTRVFFRWDNLNPQGFRYFNDYASYRSAAAEEYLQEENRAFIDAYSMCYPKEDRARIMEYACREGNEAYFRSPIMQAKLKMVCEGIRKAFKLEQFEDALLWEQYLTEPLQLK